MNIILLDDHSILAELIADYLQDNGHHILSIYNSSKDFQKSNLLNLADLFILDIGLPDSEETYNIKFINANYPHKKILIFTSNVNPDLLTEIYNLGVEGYLPKTKDKEKIIEVLELIESGTKHFENISITDLLSYKKESYLDISLTKRELEVLKLSGKSFSNQDIAEELNLSLNTI